MTDHVHVLAFDLGAGSGRALIGEWMRLADGNPRLRVSEIHRFPNEPVRFGKSLYWDIANLVREVKRGIQIAFRDGWNPATLGIDTWGVDFGLLDRNGQLIGLPHHYRDPRTEGMVEEISGLIGEEELFAQSGLQFMPFNTIYQLAAMVKAKDPKLDIAETLLTMPDLLAYLLTGRKACEYTMATTTQLFHPVERAWNTQLMGRLGIPARLFLPVSEPGTGIGPLSEDVCRELGVPPVEVIAVATHDTASAVAAVPAGETPFAYLVCGTWSLLGTERDRPLLSPEVMHRSFSNEGGAGNTWQLLKNIMGLWILQECKREWEAGGDRRTYPELVEMAEGSEPFRSLIFPDDLRFYPPGNMTERIRDYCWETGQPVPDTPGEVTRCILESLALRYRQAVEQLEALTGRTFRGLHMVGGGIQNRLLCRFTAEALGREVWAGPVEASAVGNIALQLVSMGGISGLREARRLVADSFGITTYRPTGQNQWNRAYQTYLNFARED